jgi:SAM-dependent methyltransferase
LPIRRLHFRGIGCGRAEQCLPGRKSGSANEQRCAGPRGYYRGAMLARRDLPQEYVEWNRRYHAPFGRPIGRVASRLGLGGRSPVAARFRGPFAWQANNTTRVFEYPWAAEKVNSYGHHLDVVEIGGGMAGLQWVLARAGHRVINIDPGMDAAGVGFDLDPTRHSWLSAAYDAPVRLEAKTLQEASLRDQCADVVLSVSTIEHLAPAELPTLGAEVRRILKHDGVAIFTIDLFLDLAPFTTVKRNSYGENMSVRALLDAAGLELIEGDPKELCGFEEFDPECVLRNLPKLLLGQYYPTLVQLAVARPV